MICLSVHGLDAIPTILHTVHHRHLFFHYVSISNVTTNDNNKFVLFSIGLLINTIRTDVSQLSGVETLERDLVVSASSFQRDMVTIDIEAHLKTSDALKEGELKTAVIAAIAKCLLKSQSKSNEDSNPRNVLA